jgi:hypothetical protein
MVPRGRQANPKEALQMAVSSIAVPPDPARDARARAHVDRVPTWPRHTLKVAWGSFSAGTTFRRAPGSRGERYLVNAVACECPDYQQAGNICKHVRAVVLFDAGQQPAQKRRPTYADLFPACPCGDLADGLDGRCSRCASDREFELRRQGAEIARQQIAAGLSFADVLNPLSE